MLSCPILWIVTELVLIWNWMLLGDGCFNRDVLCVCYRNMFVDVNKIRLRNLDFNWYKNNFMDHVLFWHMDYIGLRYFDNVWYRIRSLDWHLDWCGHLLWDGHHLIGGIVFMNYVRYRNRLRNWHLFRLVHYIGYGIRIWYQNYFRDLFHPTVSLGSIHPP